MFQILQDYVLLTLRHRVVSYLDVGGVAKREREIIFLQ